ncbi:MAG: hypothetical protein P8Y42_22290 [Exilibacterium sp.]
MEISLKFDTEIKCFVVIFPELVTLQSLKRWGQRFVDELNGKEGVGLLIDTGPHNFESITCLKWLKEFLTQAPEVRQSIRKVAFVSPPHHHQPEIIDDREAYFSDISDARIWLKPD